MTKFDLYLLEKERSDLQFDLGKLKLNLQWYKYCLFCTEESWYLWISWDKVAETLLRRNVTAQEAKSLYCGMYLLICRIFKCTVDQEPSYFLALSGNTRKFLICSNFHSLMCFPQNVANTQYLVKYVCPPLPVEEAGKIYFSTCITQHAFHIE